MSSGIVVADTCSVILLMGIKAPSLPFDAGFDSVLFPAENKSDRELSSTPQQDELDRWEQREGWTIHTMTVWESVKAGTITKALNEGERRACAVALETSGLVLTDDYKAIGTIRQTKSLSTLHDRLITTADLMRRSLQAGTATEKTASQWIKSIRSRPHNLQNSQRREVLTLEDLKV